MIKKGKYYYSDGTMEEYPNWDKTLHRIDGPAVDKNSGPKEWWFNGKLHREDGAAIEYHGKRRSYWIQGNYYESPPVKVFEKMLNPTLKNISLYLNDPDKNIRKTAKKWYMENK